MKMTYDPEADILAIDLDMDGARRTGGQELPFGGGYADLAADGTILALEIWDASKKYPKEMLAGLDATGAPMSLAEAAKMAGVTAVALRRACEEGRLQGRKIGRNWTVTGSALAEFVPEIRRIKGKREEFQSAEG